METDYVKFEYPVYFYYCIKDKPLKERINRISTILNKHIFEIIITLHILTTIKYLRNRLNLKVQRNDGDNKTL